LHLRFDKKKQSGDVPIYVRFQRINGKEPKFPLGIDVAEDDWNETTRLPKDPALELIVGNQVMKIKRQILNAIGNGIEITHALLKEFVEGKPNPAQRSFYDYFDEYVKKNSSRGKIRDSTRNGYDVTRRALKEYSPEIRLPDINTKFLDGFDKFLIKRGIASGKGEVLGTRSNRLKHINTVLKYIERQGVAVENPYKKDDLEIPKAAVREISLDKVELRELLCIVDDLPYGSTELRVLCMFLFSCFTGLRLGDALELQWQDIDVHNEPMILEKTTQKTGKKLTTPIPELGNEMLLCAAENNAENVHSDKRVFLCGCSQVTINNVLRKLAKQAGIEKHISYHCSRHTFITFAKMQGMDEYEIMKYAGHSNLQMTRNYMKWDKKLATESAKKVPLFRLKDLLKKKK